MKILLVDDNKSITFALSKFLRLKGHDCMVANDGKHGLSLCMEQKFDVVVLDLAMPEFTGQDFLESLVHSGKINDQKIMIFTSMPLGEVNIQYDGKGVCTVIRKPIGLDEFLKTIEGKK
jgi:two-component system OmpR family response regulator